MHPASRVRHRFRLLALTIVLLIVVTACGGSPTPPPPSGIVTLTGSIDLPAGHGIDLAGLTVSTPLGTFPVSATGAFEVVVNR